MTDGWTDEPCRYSPPHAPHLWGEEKESGSGLFRYAMQVTFRCDGTGRDEPDE